MTKTIGVMGAEMETYHHPMIMELVDPKRKKVIWQSKEILVRCCSHNNIPPLLGVSDFITNLSCTFSYNGVSGKSIIITL